MESINNTLHKKLEWYKVNSFWKNNTLHRNQHRVVFLRKSVCSWSNWNSYSSESMNDLMHITYTLKTQNAKKLFLTRTGVLLHGLAFYRFIWIEKKKKKLKEENEDSTKITLATAFL